MHLELSMPGYVTDLRGLSRTEAHQLITMISESNHSTELVRVRLEDETAAEKQSGRKGQYAEGYEVER